MAAAPPVIELVPASSCAAGRPDVGSRRRGVVVRERLAAWPRRALLPLLFGLLAAVVTVTVRMLGSDAGQDTAAELERLGADVLALHWAPCAILVLATVVHYLAAARAVRAASGCRLGLGENVRVQLAAAAANRITPVGSGGGLVNIRYLSRRGLSGPAATAAVAVLALLGGLSDVIVFALLLGAGALLELPGTARAVPQLVARAWGLLGPLRSYGVGIAVLVAVAVLVALRHRIRPGVLRDVLRPVARLARRPRDLATLVAASGTTTFVLAFAFAWTPAMLPVAHPHVAIGALMIGFMVASAAGNAIPIPGGAGSTEAALTAALVLEGWSVGPAVDAVLLFRVVTFWLPAVVGLVLLPRLRRAHVI